MPILETERDGYTISTDPARIDIPHLHQMLNSTYWASDRSLETVQRAVQHSLNFGLYYAGRMVGNARLITDYATFAWLCDVVIEPEHRARGLGKWLIETVVNHPEVRPLRRLLLATRDAHGLYQQYGFAALDKPERWMEKFNPQAR